MIAIATLLAVLFLSLIVVRVAAEALVLTGISRESASFQARSAWTGTGFTTSESEQIVNHPVRRRIVSALMFARAWSPRRRH
jgi:Trk-type K+ transport system membrane component